MRTPPLLTLLVCGIGASSLAPIASVFATQTAGTRSAEANFVITVTAPSLDHRSTAPPRSVAFDVLLDSASADSSPMVALEHADQNKGRNPTLENVLENIDRYLRRD